ncbi:glycolate oxidase subunit GlcE [Microbulbifer rhizosphaerae]|uniref:Glycolate oxidase FAD binding subunit n=1 Tax=Microbulbifer rhizosphaerae TaxID=1562603 RepID=A0A7W4Z8B6_9GAMM|nr:glycolate oxidase FAD binding subunit [Microbulbifer rhizosphaerae]
MAEQDRTQELQAALEQALAGDMPVAIRGGGSRAHFNLAPGDNPLSAAAHRGVIDYQPDELMLRVRAGTPIAELETLLAAEGQRFAADIPQPAEHSTIGGAIACGWDGPARPAGMSLRDTVLGCRMLNGRGQLVSFGGQVMKNVAGYDLSRLQVGALGTLGVLLDVSLRLLPQPECTENRSFTVSAAQLPDWWEKLRALRPLLRASCFVGTSGSVDAGGLMEGKLHLRLSGRKSALKAALQKLGGEPSAFDWRALRNLRHEFFSAPQLACVVLPHFAELDIPLEETLIDWEGARIWVPNGDGVALQRAAAKRGGFVRVLRGPTLPVANGAGDWPRRIKDAFDPRGLFNRELFNTYFGGGQACR